MCAVGAASAPVRGDTHVDSNRAAVIAALIVFAALLAACGDSEADQRKAFIGSFKTSMADPVFIFSFRRGGRESLRPLFAALRDHHGLR